MPQFKVFQSCVPLLKRLARRFGDPEDGVGLVEVVIDLVLTVSNPGMVNEVVGQSRWGRDGTGPHTEKDGAGLRW